MNTNRVSPSSLAVIRIALLSGVLLFGAVIFYLHSTGNAPAAADSALSAPVFMWVFFALCVGAAVAMVVLRGVAERAADFDRSASMTIAAWAVGEGVAILGGVHWLLTGSAVLYLAGTAVFLAGLATVSAKS